MTNFVNRGVVRSRNDGVIEDENDFVLFKEVMEIKSPELRCHNSRLLLHLGDIVSDIVANFEEDVMFYRYMRIVYRRGGGDQGIINFANVLRGIIFGEGPVGKWMTSICAIYLLKLYIKYQEHILPDDMVKSFSHVYGKWVKQYVGGRPHEDISLRYNTFGYWNIKKRRAKLEKHLVENCNRSRIFGVIWDEWSNYPSEDLQVTLVTWLPRETLEDTLSLIRCPKVILGHDN